MSRVSELQYVVPSECSKAGKHSSGFRVGRVFLLCSALLLPTTALAAAWTITPELNLRSGYDDNLRLTAEGVQNNVERKGNGGFETNASVAMEIATLTAISELRARGRFDFISYTQEQEEQLSNEDNQYVDVAGRYELTPINEVGASFSLERKYTGTDDGRDFFDSLSEADLENDGDENLTNVDTDSGVTREQVRRERLRAQPYWSVGLTQNTRLRLQYNYDDTAYGSGTLDARLIDFTRQRASVRLEHKLTETSQVFASFEGGTFEPDVGRENDELAVRFGYRYNVSPISVVGFNVGARQISFDKVAATDDDKDEGAIVRIFGEHRGELTRYTASVGRTVTPSGSGALVESDILQFDFIRSLSPRFEFRFESEYFGNSAVSNSVDERGDRDKVRFSPMLRWNWTPEWAINLIYEYEWEERSINKDDITGDTLDADSNGIFVSIVYRKDNEIGQKN